MASTAEQLILRGLNILMRTTFAPNDPERQAKHMIGLQADISPWFSDYAEEIAKPAVDFDLEIIKEQAKRDPLYSNQDDEYPVARVTRDGV